MCCAGQSSSSLTPFCGLVSSRYHLQLFLRVGYEVHDLFTTSCHIQTYQIIKDLLKDRKIPIFNPEKWYSEKSSLLKVMIFSRCIMWFFAQLSQIFLNGIYWAVSSYIRTLSPNTCKICSEISVRSIRNFVLTGKTRYCLGKILIKEW